MSRVVSPFEDGLEDRLLGQYPEYREDVAMALSNAKDMIKRKRVRNPNGLAVTLVRQAVAKAKAVESRGVSGGDSDLYAAMLVQLLQVVAESQLGPAAIARALAQARKAGYGKLNPVLVEKLEALGEYWPQGR